MSPLNERRLAQFKSNRRGYYSLFVFLTLFVVSLFAEFVANDKPILMYHQGELYMPVLFTYSEQELGGELPIEPMYSEPYMQTLVRDSGGWMLMPLIPFSYKNADLYIETSAPAPPSARHWLGTDDSGKDTLARLIYGFRLSVLFGITLTIFSSIIGVCVGAVQGYFGGRVDLVGQRLVEIWTGLPILLLLIILASLVKPNVFWLLGILTLFSWMPLVSVVRAEVLRTRNFEYVRAARSMGTSDLGIIARHVLPNAMVATLTFMPFILSGAVTMLTALDFLGFGLPAGSPSLGELLAQGKANIQAPWLGLTGFFTLGLMLTLLIFIGEAVRDALDPRRTMATVYQG
ncbi:MAG TPA: ABC transporter permease [Gammaproteobacteria bacterium]|nr:ABC transporter permease [Gammaproteobacteria bacterium]